jgi:hypothetical protein
MQHAQGDLLSGRYELHGLIGKGATTWTYAARDRQTGRSVSVVTLNALRRHLRDRGCIEERVLQSFGANRIHIEICCRTKPQRCCRAVLGAEQTGWALPRGVLEAVRRRLAPCLGSRWIDGIPDENPFG